MKSNEYLHLLDLFKSDINSALMYSEQLMCGDTYSSLNTFLEQNKARDTRSHCQKAWTTPHLVVRCNNCCLGEKSYMCLDCFLNGNHKDHDYTLLISQNGICKCGNPMYFKDTGFCKNHQIHEINMKNCKITEENRNLLIQIFKAAWSQADFLCAFSPGEMIKILKWLMQFINVGDNFAHLVSISICEGNQLEKIIREMDVFTLDLSNQLSNFIHSLLNIQFFNAYFAKIAYSSYIHVLHLLIRSFRSKLAISNFEPLLKTMFGAFQRLSMNCCIECQTDDFDWVKICSDLIESHVMISKQFEMPFDKFNVNNILKLVITSLSDVFADKIQKSNIEKFFKQIYKTFSSIALYPDIHVKMNEDVNDFISFDFIQQIGGYLMLNLLEMEELPDISLLAPYLLNEINEIENPDSTWRKLVNETNFYENSVLSCGHTSSHLFFHLILVAYLHHDIQKSKETLQKIAEGYNGSFSEFCRALIILPVRLFALISSHSNNMIESEPESMMFLLNTVDDGESLVLRFIPLFSLVQFVVAAADDKEMMIRTIADAFGVFEDMDLPYDKIVTHRFSFLKFIISICTNSATLTFNRSEITKQFILIKSATYPMTIDDIEKLISISLLNTNEVAKIVLTLLKSHKEDDEEIFKPKFMYDIEPFSPWAKSNESLNIIADIIRSPPNDSLYTIPDLIHEMNFKDLIETKTFISALLLFLLDNSRKQAAVNEHIVMSLLYTISRNKREEICGKSDVSKNEIKSDIMKGDIKKSDIMESDNSKCDLMESDKSKSDLMESDTIKSDDSKCDTLQIISNKDILRLLPDTFIDQMQTPIKYKNQNPESIIEIISKFDKLGQRVLNDMNFSCQIKEVKPLSGLDKEKAKNARLRAQKALLDSMKAFEKNNFCCLHEDRCYLTCSVCHNEGDIDDLVYPVLYYETVIPSIIESFVNGSENLEQKKSLSLMICPHILHFSCLESGYYSCPVDRCVRNHFLPRVLDPNQKLSEKQIDIMKKFLEGLHLNCSNALSILGESLANSILIDEVRMRTNEPVLTTECSLANCRSFFLTIASLCRNNLIQPKIEHDDSLTRLIIECAISDKPEETFINISQQIMKSQTIPSLSFARRAFIFYQLCIKSLPIEDVVCLTDHFLSDFFKIEINHETLKEFHLKNLPDRIIDFSLDPFNFRIDDMSRNIGYCLLTGKLVDLSHSNLYSKNILSHMKTDCLNNVTLFLIISGPNAGRVIFYNTMFQKKVLTVKSFYQDSFGGEDIGFQRGRPTLLKHDLLSKYTDDLITGQWTSLIDKDWY